jgi:hypothetical protein
MVEAEASGPVSIANLARDQWTVQSVDRPGVSGPLTLRYQLDGRDVDGEIRRVRGVVEELHEHYRRIKSADTLARPERYALLERLSAARVMPSEMALMVGVDVQLAERFAGDDEEARITRTLLHSMTSDHRGVDA